MNDTITSLNDAITLSQLKRDIEKKRYTIEKQLRSRGEKRLVYLLTNPDKSEKLFTRLNAKKEMVRILFGRQ